MKYSLLIVTFFLVLFITFMLNLIYIKKHTNLIQVAVANKKIPAYSLVSKKDIILENSPKSVVPDDAVIKPEVFFKGNTYYTRVLGFGTGDIICKNRMSTGNNETEMDSLVKYTSENKMMISINTDLVRSCSNMVIPGTYVDAVVYVEGKGFEGQDRIISPAEDERLSNLLVVDKKNSSSSKPEDKGREALPAVVTLVIDKDKLEIAKALVEYNEKGKIYLLPVNFCGQMFLASEKNYNY